MSRSGSRDTVDPGSGFVYMNQDGSVRDLSPAERAYLSQEFSGGDSGRPYIKSSYQSRDGWGSLSGFIERHKVPTQTKVLPVHPDFDGRVEEQETDHFALHRAAGDIIETNADGSVTCTPNPRISRTDRFELMRSCYLARQRERESLALVNHPNGKTNP